MKPDQERVKVLLTETIALLCKNGLNFKKDVRVQGLLGITVDNTDVFIVQLNESLWSGDDDQNPSNDIPVSSPESTEISKSPRRRSVLADRDSPSAATHSISDEKTLNNSSDAPGRSKTRNDKLSSSVKRHADKSETTDNILNNARPVEIKTECLTVEQDIVLIDDDDGGRDDVGGDDVGGYDLAGTSYDKRHQSFDEHCQNFDDLKDIRGNYPGSKRLRRANSSSERLFSPLSSTAMTSREEATSGILETSSRVKLEIDPDGPSVSDERHFQGYDESYTSYPWEGGEASSTDYSSTHASDSFYAFPSSSRPFPSRNSNWYSERKRCPSSVGPKSLPGRPLHPAAAISTGSSTFYGGTTGGVAGRNTGGSVGAGGGFGGNAATRFGFTRYKRFNVKTFVCQFADCGKTFCHSYHLYRHQREKHGCRYDNPMSRLNAAVSANLSVSPVRQSSSLGLKSLNSHQSPTQQISPLASTVMSSSQGQMSTALVSPVEQKPDANLICFQPGCTHVFCSVAGLSCHLKGSPTQPSDEHLANS